MKERSVGKARKPKTQTTPKGTEIPVPKRGEFMRDLRKVATPKADPRSNSNDRAIDHLRPE